MRAAGSSIANDPCPSNTNAVMNNDSVQLETEQGSL